MLLLQSKYITITFLICNQQVIGSNPIAGSGFKLFVSSGLQYGARRKPTLKYFQVLQLLGKYAAQLPFFPLRTIQAETLQCVSR